MKLLSIIIISIIGFVSFNAYTHTTPTPQPKVILRSNIKWSPLNPARGNKSPQAGNLWGDRHSTKSSGFLVTFADGFESPAHTHNVSYRGIVISGLIHNDDPKAKKMWLPPRSFWTQPAGETHITAARGQENIAYIEIDNGPYLVKPISQEFDNGEQPVNVDKSNLVWLNASDIKWIDSDTAKIAFLWGNHHDKKLNGSLVKIPAGKNAQIISDGPIFHAVIIQGSPIYNKLILKPGSYFGSENSLKYSIISDKKKDSIIYIRTNGKLRITKTL